MNIPTLADHLAGRTPTVELEGVSRVHTLEDRPMNPVIANRKPAPPKEEPMPRKPKDTAAAPVTDAKPEKKRRGPKPGTKKPAHRKDGQPIGAARFVIDDRGGMEIRDGQQVVQLERDDVQRLTTFLDRTKGIRS